MPKSEKQIQYQVYIKGAIILICAGLYAWGGLEDKWLRRYLAPAFGVGTVCLLTENWRHIWKAPVIMLASSLGYGASEFWMKVLMRLKVGACHAMASLTNYHKWPVIAASFLVIPAVFILFGVFNPFHARTEEFFLGLIIYTFALLPIEEDYNGK